MKKNKVFKIGNYIIHRIQINNFTLGTDRVYFCLDDAPTNFPELQEQDPDNKYIPMLQVETRKGYAKEWLEKTFGKEIFGIVQVIGETKR